MSKHNTHDGHRARLRQRFHETGTSGFSEHELLEFLLFYALPRVNTNEIAHRLMERFGSISAILSAKTEELSQVKGISSSSSAFLKFVCDMCKRYSISGTEADIIRSQEDLENIFSSYFSSIESEICLIFSISMNYKILRTISFPAEKLCTGEITPRELAEIAIKNNIHRIVIGTNHPGRLPVPTENDYTITNLIAGTLSPLGIEISDCIVCGSGKSFSMRKNGAFSFLGGGTI